MTDVRTTSVQLAARGLTRHFSVRTPGAFFARSASCTRLMASVSTGRGEVVAVVGESGSGKSVLARMLARIITRPLEISSSRASH